MDKSVGLAEYEQVGGTADEYVVPVLGAKQETWVCWLCGCDVDQQGRAINGDHAPDCPFVGVTIGDPEQRQELVDNKIFDLFQEVNPHGLIQVPWDIEMIGEVRDVVQRWLVERLQICTAEEFYPSHEEEG